MAIASSRSVSMDAPPGAAASPIAALPARRAPAPGRCDGCGCGFFNNHSVNVNSSPLPPARAALRQIWQVYSTSDLKTWTFHGNVLPLGPPRPNATLFSPKAVFNAGTGLWCERKVEARLCRNFETSLSACRRAGWKSRRELWGVAVRIYGKRWETLYVSHNVGHCSLGAACSAPLRAAGFCGTT